MDVARKSDGIKVDVDDAILSELAEIPLNGRQVRWEYWPKLLLRFIDHDFDHWDRSRTPSALQSKLQPPLIHEC
jgi:hypothetical protein